MVTECTNSNKNIIMNYNFAKSKFVFPPLKISVHYYSPLSLLSLSLFFSIKGLTELNVVRQKRTCTVYGQNSAKGLLNTSKTIRSE